MARHILLALGWLVAGAVLAYSLSALLVLWNLIDFHPDWSGSSLLAVVGVVMATVACWFLARSTRGKAARVFSFLVCAGVLAIGLSALPPEPALNGQGRNLFDFLSRDRPSPLWFRGGILLLAALPMAFWLSGPRDLASASSRKA